MILVQAFLPVRPESHRELEGEDLSLQVQLYYKLMAIMVYNVI